MRFAVVVFPGSNCDEDVRHVVANVMGEEVVSVWHKSRDLQGADAVVLPGGFSYGDYLRTGALARHSPVMEEVAAFSRRGGPVLGICNGFQILLESGLLPGAMVRNRDLRFICDDVTLAVEGQPTRFTARLRTGQTLVLPIAHAEGNYTADEATLDRLEGEGRVVLRYVDAVGRASPESNPNGSMRNIAGISNEAGNVVGMMPHPERAAEALLGNTAGLAFFQSVFDAVLA
jgi:phosphoribosylformylglycinamidine synthase I